MFFFVEGVVLRPRDHFPLMSTDIQLPQAFWQAGGRVCPEKCEYLTRRVAFFLSKTFSADIADIASVLPDVTGGFNEIKGQQRMC